MEDRFQSHQIIPTSRPSSSPYNSIHMDRASRIKTCVKYLNAEVNALPDRALQSIGYEIVSQLASSEDKLTEWWLDFVDLVSTILEMKDKTHVDVNAHSRNFTYLLEESYRTLAKQSQDINSSSFSELLEESRTLLDARCKDPKEELIKGFNLLENILNLNRQAFDFYQNAQDRAETKVSCCTGLLNETYANLMHTCTSIWPEFGFESTRAKPKEEANLTYAVEEMARLAKLLDGAIRQLDANLARDLPPSELDLDIEQHTKPKQSFLSGIFGGLKALGSVCTSRQRLPERQSTLSLIKDQFENLNKLKLRLRVGENPKLLQAIETLAALNSLPKGKDGVDAMWTYFNALNYLTSEILECVKRQETGALIGPSLDGMMNEVHGIVHNLCKLHSLSVVPDGETIESVVMALRALEEVVKRSYFIEEQDVGIATELLSSIGSNISAVSAENPKEGGFEIFPGLLSGKFVGILKDIGISSSESNPTLMVKRLKEKVRQLEHKLAFKARK